MSVKIPVVLETDLPGLKPFKRGKVRDLYDLDDSLLFVATDRISAFDSILPTGIPLKGKILTTLSTFWFELTQDIAPNHLISADITEMGDAVAKYSDILAGRSMRVKKTDVVPIECVVRGYLAGSGWQEYQTSSTVCGIKLPEGLRESEKLPETLFTPATKAESGHDENISFEELVDIVGNETAEALRDKSIAIYERAAEHALKHGVIISDTKFEWGSLNGELILIDEVLTPDSSRFWPEQTYRVGSTPPSFDKQYVRDYLNEIGWDHEPPAPELPPEVVEKTTEKYLDALRRLTSKTTVQ